MVGHFCKVIFFGIAHRKNQFHTVIIILTTVITVSNKLIRCFFYKVTMQILLDSNLNTFCCDVGVNYILRISIQLIHKTEVFFTD